MFLVDLNGGTSLSPLSNATLSLTILYNIPSLASFLLSWSDFHSSVASMLSTLERLPKRLLTYLAPLRWTISSCWMSFWWYGSQTVEAYSSVGLTKVLYAFSLTDVETMFKLCRRNPNVLFVFPQMLLMWSLQRRSDVATS